MDTQIKHEVVKSGRVKNKEVPRTVCPYCIARAGESDIWTMLLRLPPAGNLILDKRQKIST